MNKTFRSLWNASKQAYVAVAETVSTQGKPSSGSRRSTLVTALLGSLLGWSAQAQAAPPTPPAPTALPTGGQVSAGAANISSTVGQSGANMVIQQSSDRAAINWQTFNVGSSAQVQFKQPSASSVTLNRVLSADPSQIFGRITANGQVILSNPSGVYFGASARVDVGGLIATTHGMGDADFMAGNTRFERNGSTASVVNEGELKAALGGYIALLAPEVRNQGAVIAQMGTVALASGEAVDLRFDSNNRLTSLRVEPSQIQALVDNQHAVQAPGGLVILSAQSLDRLVGGVVKNSGAVEATGLQSEGGRIVLSGSKTVDNSGSLNVSSSTAQGGSVSLQGENITLQGSSRIDATGATGGGTVLVGGNWQGSADPLIEQTLGQPSQAATTVTMAAGASIDASATVQGNGGTVVLWSTDSTDFAGQIQAQGQGAGHRGGDAEVSGKQRLSYSGFSNLLGGSPGLAGQLLLDPYNLYVMPGSTGSLTATGDNSVLGVDTLTAALTGAHVTVSTGSGGTQTGNIGILTDITSASTNNLTLSAAGNIVVDSNITLGGALNVQPTGNFVMGANLSSGVGAAIVANGGFTKTGAGTSYLTGSITTQNAAITIAGPVQVGSFDGTPVALNSNGGNIALTGAVSAYSGANLQGYAGLIAQNMFSGVSTGGAATSSTMSITFGTAGNWMFTPLWGMSGAVDYLVVGGGGGGGQTVPNYSGGGGGGGGVATGSMSLSSGTLYTMTVGAGGAAGSTSNGPNSNAINQGGDTSFNGVLSGGGGAGGGFYGGIGAAGQGGAGYAAGGGGGGHGGNGDNNAPSGAGGLGGTGTQSLGGLGSWNYGNSGGAGGGSGAISTSTYKSTGVTSSITGSSVAYGVGGGGWASDTNWWGGGGTTAGTGGGGGSAGYAGAVILGFSASNNASTSGLSLHSGAGTVTLGATVSNLSNLTVNAGGTASIGGIVSGTGSLTKAGSGTLELSLQNTYTGGTTVDGGTLVLKDVTNNSDGVIRGTLTVNAAGTVQLTGNAGYAGSLGWGSNRVTTLNINGGLVEAPTGSGKQSLWNLTGGLNFNGGGTLRSNGGTSDAAAASYLELSTTNITVSNASAPAVIAGRLSLRNDNGTPTFTVADGAAANDLLISAAITEANGTGITKAGAGKLTLAGSNSYSGTTTISAGTLQVGAAGTSGTLGSGGVTNNAALVFDRSDAVTVANAISGTGSVSKLNSNTLTLSGVSSYSGGSTVSAGVLKLGNSSGLGSGSVTVADGAALDLYGFNASNALFVTGSGVASGGVIFNSSSSTGTASGAITLTGDSSFKSATGGLNLGTVNGAYGLTVNTATSFTQSGRVGGTTAPTAYTVNAGGGTATLSAAITAAGPVSVSGNDVNINNNAHITSTLNGAGISVLASRNIALTSDLTFTTNDGNLLFASDTDGTGGGSFSALNTMTANTTGAGAGVGHITIGGGNSSGTGYATGTGGGAGNSSYYHTGVAFSSPVTLTSGGGNISIKGQSSTGNGVGARTWGVGFDTTTTIDSGTGTVSIDGVSRNNADGYSAGVFFNFQGGTTSITSANTTADAIRVIGSAATAGNTTWGQGIRFNYSGASLTATGAGGGITLQGTRSTAANSTDDIYLEGGNILANGGAINIVGASAGGRLHLRAATLGKKASTTVTSSSSNVSLTADDVFFYLATADTTGAFTLQPYSNDFSSALTWPVTNLSLGSGVSGLTLGKASSADGSSDVDVTVSSATSIAGPIALYGRNIAINAALTSTGTISLKSSITVTDGASGYVVADKLALLGGSSVSLDSASNAIGTLAASGVGSLTYVDSNALSIGTVGATNGINATGAVSVVTLTGDLTVSQSVATTNTSSSALLLNADKNAAAGTAAGGNLVLSGSPTISVGSGGTAKLYTGSVSGSTGLATLVGSGSGRFRYNADETTNFATGAWTNLGTGTYAIYRERPTANVTGMTLSMTYGDALPGITATGTVNGDGSSYTIASALYSTANLLKASGTPYTITQNLSGLGYSVSGTTSGTLAVSTKALNVTGLTAVNKAYDGNTTATLSGTMAFAGGGVSSSDGRSLSGDALSLVGTASGSFADKNVANGQTVTISGLSLSGADASNYTLNATTTTANITPKTVSLSASKTYDGLLDLGGWVSIATGVAGETLTYTGASASDAHVATSAKYISAITLGNQVGATPSAGGLASNYQLPTLNASNAAVTIHAKALTATASISAAAKTYDGLLAATGSTASGMLSGALNGDSITLDTSGLALAFSDAHVATANKTIGATGSVALGTLTAGGVGTMNGTTGNAVAGALSDYALAVQPTIAAVAGTINALALTATAPTISGTSKTYDGLLAASASSLGGGSVTGFVGADAGSLNTSGVTLAYNDAHVATANKTISASGNATLAFVGTATGAGNGSSGHEVAGQSTDYSFTAPTIAAVAGTINAKPLTATASISAAAKTYDGMLAATGSTASGTLSGALNGDSITLDTSGLALAFSDAHVATANKTIGATGSVALGTLAAGGVGSMNGTAGNAVAGALSDYALAAQPTIAAVAGTINAKALTISGLTSANKVYDGTTAAAVNGAAALQTAIAAGSGSSSDGKAYSGDAVSLTGSAVGTFNTQNVATANTVTFSGLSLSGADASNYTLTPHASASHTVARATLTATANQNAKFLTQSDPLFTVSVSGFVNGETAGSAGGYVAPTVARAGSDAVAGTYAGVLHASGGSADNYQFSPVAGDFTIVPSNQLLVRVVNASSTYGSATQYALSSVEYFNGSAVVRLDNGSVANSSSTLNASNLLSVNDGANGSASFTLAPQSAVSSSAGKLAVGSYQLGASGAVTVNSVNFSNTVTVVGAHQVSTQGVTASAASVSKVYDGTVAATGVSLALATLETGDAVSVSGQGAFASKNVGTGLGYTMANVALSGTDAGNYHLTGGNSFSGSNGVITPRTLTVSYTGVSKVYDGGTSASVTSSDDRISGDALTLTRSASFADKNVGTGKAVSVTGVSLGGADAGNYTLATTGSASANITRLGSVSWIGGSSGNWFDPANWAGGAVPDLANVANVVIPQGVTVSFDTAGAVSPADASGAVHIDGLGTGGSLTQTNGTLNVGAGGIALDTLTQNGGTLSNAGATTLSSYNQNGGSYSGSSNFTTGHFTQTGGTTALGGNLTVTQGFGQGSSGSVTVAGNTSITDTSGGMVLGNLSTTGTTTLSSTNGAITQAAGTALVSGGAANITASDGGNPATPYDINLSNAGNDFGGTVNASGATVALTDANALTLGTVNATGNLTVNSTGALDLGTSTVGGNLSANSHGGDLNLGTSSISGNLSANSGNGDITQTGALTVAGTTGLTAGTGNVTLTNAGNDFTGTVSASGNNVALTDANALSLGTVTTTGNLSLNSTGALDMGTSTVSGDLSVNSHNGNITQTGALSVNGTTGLTAGTGNVTLTNAGNDFTGAVSASGNNVALTDANALSLGTVNATGNLTVNSTGALDLGTSTVGGNLSANSHGGDLNLGTSSIGGNLTANSGNGNITQTGALHVAGETSLLAGQGTVNLPHLDNSFPNGVTVTAASYAIAGDARQLANEAQARAQSSVAVSGPVSAAASSAAPAPLVLVSNAGSAASGGSSAGSANAAAPSAGNSSGVTVELREGVASDVAIMAAVSLPKGIAVAGTGFSFELPEVVRTQAANQSVGEPRLANGATLPAWLKFDVQTLSFQARAVPDGAFPMQVALTVGAQRVVVVISERTD